MSSDINQIICTVEEQLEVLYQMDEILKYIYKSDNEDIQQFINKTARYGITEAIFSRLSDQSDRLVQAKTIEKMKEEIKELRVLKLTFAINPTVDTMKKVCQWVKTNIGQDVILAIDVNNRIVAGIILSFEGRYGIFTARNKFDKYWENNRKDIERKLNI